MKEFAEQVLALWLQYSTLVLFVAGLAGGFALISLAVWAKRSKKPLRPIALAFSMNLALMLNAEGMWVIATDEQGLNLPPLFAVLVFAVFEICFLTATSLAAEQYRRTTITHPDGTVQVPGHPGRMLWVAALIAGLSGAIVASYADTFTEKLLRLGVPAVIFLMWWAALTAAGQRARQRSRFAYSPRRLAERWGWLIPDEDEDLAKLKADRQVNRMVVAYQRAAGKGVAERWGKARLRKDARTASAQVVERVREQLARIDEVMALLDPDRAPEPEEPRTEEPVRPRPQPSVPQARAARHKTGRVRRMRLQRRVCAAHPVVRERTVQVTREDLRTAQEKALVVRAVKAVEPRMSQRRLARIVDLPESTLREILPRIAEPKPAQKTNGHNVLAETQS